MSDDTGLLQHHEPESWRFYVYGEDDAGEPLFSFWMNISDETGVCIYQRLAGEGMWLSTAHDDEEYDGEPPSGELKQALRDVIEPEGYVTPEELDALPNHEEHFFRAIHGTIEQKGKAPDELLRFVEHVVGGEVRLA